MKLLVIGKQGQLARSLVERAAFAQGIQIACAGRPEVDLARPGSAARAVADSGANAVVNAAAYTAVDAAETNKADAFRINAAAAGEIAEAASQSGMPLIHLSTDYVFDGEMSGAYTENAETNPLSVYGRSKLAGEEAVRAAGQHTILRSSWVYSPFGRNFVRTIWGAAEQRDRLSVVDDQRGSPTSALDLADAILALVARWQRGEGTGLGELYHVAGSGVTTWCGFARAIANERKRHGLHTPVVDASKSGDWQTLARRPRNSVLDSGRFTRAVGFVMPDWRNSLKTVTNRLARDA